MKERLVSCVPVVFTGMGLGGDDWKLGDNEGKDLQLGDNCILFSTLFWEGRMSGFVLQGVEGLLKWERFSICKL